MDALSAVSLLTMGFRMISPEEVEQLRTKHVRVKHVVINGMHFVFRKPSRQECIQHAMHLEESQSRPLADEGLARATVVHPSREVFSQILEDWPYLYKHARLSKALAQLAGMVDDEEVKNDGSSIADKCNSLPISAVA